MAGNELDLDVRRGRSGVAVDTEVTVIASVIATMLLAVYFSWAKCTASPDRDARKSPAGAGRSGRYSLRAVAA